MNNKPNQAEQANQQSTNVKLTWQKPAIEICNIEQTMTTTGSNGDGGGSTP